MASKPKHSDKLKPVMRSMTGFGKASANAKGVVVDLEIRTVNSRFLDISCKIPKTYIIFEGMLRSVIAESIKRGRVELSLSRSFTASSSGHLNFNRTLFDEYLGVFKGVQTELRCQDDEVVSRFVAELLMKPEIMQASDEIFDESAERDLVEQVTRQALVGVVEMRLEEGRRIGLELDHRLQELIRYRKEIEHKVPSSSEALKVRLLERVKLLAPEVNFDQSRLHQELAFIADKVDVAEELARLESHFSQFEQALTVWPTGRKLEFLLQEVGREFNTLGSKIQNADIQGLVVECKSILESFKEQVLNLE